MQGKPETIFYDQRSKASFLPWLSTLSSDASTFDHPQKSCHPDFLQPPCAYADGFAVVTSSFWFLMTALSPAFDVVDRVIGLNLNDRSAVRYKIAKTAVTSWWSGCRQIVRIFAE